MREYIKPIAVVLVLMMALSALCACGGGAAEPTPEPTATPAPSAVVIDADGQQYALLDAAGKTVDLLLEEAGVTLNEGDVLSFDSTQVLGGVDLIIHVLRNYSATSVIIDVDGQQLPVADPAGKTVQQMLEESGVTLNEGDVVAVSTEQQLGGELTVQVLRRCRVTVAVTGETPLEDVHYTVVLVGGTVADAISAAGIELGEDKTVDHALEEALVNDMVIVISPVAAEEEEAEEPEEEAEEEAEEEQTTQTSGQTYTGTWTAPQQQPVQQQPAEQQPAEQPPAEQPAEQPPVEAAPTQPEAPAERVLVSSVDYPDCDGSGHGVMVNTYSDGTQEEVPY